MILHFFKYFNVTFYNSILSYFKTRYHKSKTFYTFIDI